MSKPLLPTADYSRAASRYATISDPGSVVARVEAITGTTFPPKAAPTVEDLQQALREKTPERVGRNAGQVEVMHAEIGDKPGMCILVYN